MVSIMIYNHDQVDQDLTHNHYLFLYCDVLSLPLYYLAKRKQLKVESSIFSLSLQVLSFQVLHLLSSFRKYYIS